MKRIGSEFLKKWLSGKNRKPIVLRGARQVGKSTLVRLFAQENNLTLMEINLERYLYLDDLFKSFQTEKLLKEIEALTGTKRSENSLLFLDEVQAIPQALACIRYLKEDFPSLPIIAAGSLLEFTLADHSFSMPVGRIDYRHLGPMTFQEFLTTLSPELTPYLEEFSVETSLPEAVHQKLLEKQREYLFVGGMPEAVKVYQESHSFEEVQEVHRSICDTYFDDFSKYAKQQQLNLLQKTFRLIPAMIGKKMKYKHISADHRSAEIRHSLDLLMKAKVINGVFSSSCSGLPLNADQDGKIFKPLFLDIGLVNHLTGLDWLAISGLTDQDLVNKGALAEQLIGQQLCASPDMKKNSELNYWLREGKSSNAEVDYIISHGDWIIPIEVKSGKSGTLKSLHQFVFSKSPPIAIRFDTNPPSLQNIKTEIQTKMGTQTIRFRLLSLPLYAVGKLPKIIEKMRK